MDWSKTKTIFIVAFLVLDIFLAIQFFAKKDSSQYAIIQDVPIEKQLAAEDITYGELPSGKEKGFSITAKTKEFTYNDINKLKDQTFVAPENESKEEVFSKIRMKLKKPIPVPNVNVQAKINQFVRDNIYSGEEYAYWHKDKESNTIIYVQQYKGQMIFQNSNENIGMIVLFLNSKNEIYEYEQTSLVDFEEKEQEELLQALKAIEVLYNKGYLKSKSHIKEVEYGYHTQVPLSGQQVLAPTWHIVVETDEQEEDFYVHAIEGRVLQSSN